MPAAVSPESPARRAGTTRTTLTHCPYCSLQCGMNVTAGDRPATLVPADFPTNKGGLCSKGWSSTELLDPPERLLPPLGPPPPRGGRPRLRAGGPRGARTSPRGEWGGDGALGRLGAGIRCTQRDHGR